MGANDPKNREIARLRGALAESEARFATLCRITGSAVQRRAMAAKAAAAEAVAELPSALELRLEQAVFEGGLHLVYQPIVALPSREIVAFEALVRWVDPDLGFIGPDVFIPIAEANGLILPLGQWVLETACRQLHEWRADPYADDLAMNVNLSAVQFRQPSLVRSVGDVLDASPRAAGHLNLELTETALLERPDAQAPVLQGLRDLGCEIHIDDFGTGYSSLSNLVRLPVDALKVDREFVGRADVDARSRSIVATVARMAQEMGLELTAEGIETEAQVRLVSALGRCHGQGYLFSRPLAPDAAHDLLFEPTTLHMEAS
jgi:EAL domain-containing protein (putative c-di-GMP-specific phosphodiesterase class I)